MYHWKLVVFYNILRNQQTTNAFINQLESMSDGGMKTRSMGSTMPVKVNAHIVVTSNSQSPDGRLPNRLVEIKARLSDTATSEM